MTTKNFMVVRLLKSDTAFSKSPFEFPDMFDDYDQAFDRFNQIVSEEKEQEFRQPKGEQPLRASLQYEDVELWIISRTTDLVKA